VGYEHYVMTNQEIFLPTVLVKKQRIAIKTTIMPEKLIEYLIKRKDFFEKKEKVTRFSAS
jgi:hypothetical protein